MPGWYIHTEAAKKTIERLRAGDVPADFPGGEARARELGEQAYEWRNYLAAGAIGPDIFFLLPDFKGPAGNTLLTFVDWVHDVYEFIDKEFMEKWQTWVEPAIDGVGDFIDNMSGGVLGLLGQALTELANAIILAIADLIAQLWDWFGLLTSGVPQGFADSGFFWSDMLHYRSTYEFPRRLMERAEQSGKPEHKAFALGWMSHCATDVSGHAFVNQKCGGPFRLHWQRHHLIENHMDAHVYAEQHNGVEPYGQLDTSLLHLRLAFHNGHVPPYQGRNDAPAFDYFAGLPWYDPTDSPAGRDNRKALFRLDSLELPTDLCQLLIDTMRDVYGDVSPLILTDADPTFRDGDSGRPSVLAIQNAWWSLYKYVKFTSTGGYSPKKPERPPVFNDHRPPSPPGSGGAGDDPSRGGMGSDDDWDLLDMFLSLLSWADYIGRLGLWLATLPAAIVADLLTYPARELLYEFAVEPFWNLYMATRRPLVMTGFLVPKYEEVSRGLVALGVSTGSTQELAAALNAPDGTLPQGVIGFDDPSGRRPGEAFGADPAYPRAIVEDEPTSIARALQYLKPDLFCGNPKQPSEFLRPWRYPDRNNAGDRNGWEAALTHSGPYLQGQDARVLMNKAPGQDTARKDFETASTPDATAQHAHDHLPRGEHLGDVVDYGVYLAGRMAAGPVPGFNLDADRGYGARCWNWDRESNVWVTPDFTGNPANDAKYTFAQPCTPPEGFCGPPAHYDPSILLAIHYLDQDVPGCGDTIPVDQATIERVGFPPAGQPG